MPPNRPQPSRRPEPNEQKGLQDLRYDQNESQAVVAARQNELRDLGFSDEFIENFFVDTLVGANTSVRQRLEFLSSQGFTDPIALVEKQPSIIGFSSENINNKLTNLRNQGFTNPIVLVEKLPTIIGYSPENIDNKLTELRNQGFTNPIALVEKQPSIIGLSAENINNKLTNLRNQGFTDPITLVEKAPPIISLSPENINRRIKLFRHLVYMFDSPIDPIELMQQELGLFGCKIDKLLTLTRIVRNSLQMASEVDRKLIHDIMFANLEDILLALEEIGDKQESDMPDYTIQQLVAKSKYIKKQKISKDIKRDRIKESEHIDEKVKKRYFKGYPMK